MKEGDANSRAQQPSVHKPQFLKGGEADRTAAQASRAKAQSRAHKPQPQAKVETPSSGGGILEIARYEKARASIGVAGRTTEQRYRERNAVSAKTASLRGQRKLKGNWRRGNFAWGEK